MKFTRLFAAAILFLAQASGLMAATWDMDMSHSDIGFSVRHMMVSKVKGTFGKAKGVLEYDEKNLAASKIDVEIDVVTINTNNGDRDNHLRGADFFEVEKNPKMTFKSRTVTRAGKGYKAEGDLTIRGVTRPVTLNVESLNGPITDPWGNQRMGTEATATINRKDFGITWNKSMDAGGVAVADEVTITIAAEFVKRK